MTNTKPLAPKPDHVPSELVVDYDFYSLAHPDTDYQINITRRLHAGPDIIWTPRNGGHWVFTRAKDIDYAQRDDGLFSIREVTIPAGTTPSATSHLRPTSPSTKNIEAFSRPRSSPRGLSRSRVRSAPSQLI